MMELYRAAEAFTLASPEGYLLPMLAIAAVVRVCPHRWVSMLFLRTIGVASHEICHLMVGYLTCAKPVRITLIPRREGNQIILGAVEFERLSWANAWVTALAPLLALPALFALAHFRTSDQSGGLALVDLAWWTFGGPIVLHCWPSRADWRLALISWPILCVSVMFAVLYVWTHDWSFLFAWRSVES